MKENPFEIKTPEQNSAQDVVDLFVDVFPDFYQVLEKGHTFINGPRGSGKSMMFRYIQPDCQCLAKHCQISELDYFAVYVPIKLTNLNIPDLARLETHAEIILNEHLLTTYVMSNVYKSVGCYLGNILNDYKEQIWQYYNTDFRDVLSYCGVNNIVELPNDTDKDGLTMMELMAKEVERINRSCRIYCNKIALSKDTSIPYDGPIVDFIDFMKPLLVSLKSLPFFPQDKPLYILIDDAGYLNVAQTKVLNTWVSYRTTKDICFKISTQLDYKTHLTNNEKRIDAPHDYSEINISTVYSSSKSKYNERLQEIVKKRLKRYLHLDIETKDFFPEDKEQELKIQEIYNQMLIDYADPEKKYAGGDAARRYARPEYITRLQQNHKAGSTYSYAGFDQLVAVSSGIIRHFLAPAQEMYSLAITELGANEDNITSIKPSIQDEVIKKYSNNYLVGEFEKLKKDIDNNNTRQIQLEKLYRMIDSLGQLFHLQLTSNSSERRVFSVAITDTPDDEMNEIIDMGEQLGYFHKSTIGNKTGTGRNRLIILSRILAPHFKLDATSFAGYKFMDSAKLRMAMIDTKRFLAQFKFTEDDSSSATQLLLFDGNNPI